MSETNDASKATPAQGEDAQSSVVSSREQEHEQNEQQEQHQQKQRDPMERAHELFSAGKLTEALAVCEEIYEAEADKLDNLLLIGAVHYQLRNFSESIFYNQQAIRVNPEFAEAYGNLGNSLRDLGDVNGAVQFYLKAIKLRPRFCDAYNNLASAYMQLGKVAQAMETYQMALVLNPTLVHAHSNLGNLYKAQGRLADAKRCYLEAIKIEPGFASAWSNLAGVFRSEGDVETAIAYFQEAIRISPQFADAYSNLGNLLKDTGRLEDAKKAYLEAIKLRPDFAIAHGNLASVYYEERLLDKAIASYKHAIQLESNFPDAYNNYGNALRETGKLAESIKMYRTCLRLKPDHPHAYNNLGNALKDKKMIKEAVHCFVTAIRLMPRFAAAHSNLASVLKEQGKIDEAIAHYQEAITIDPNFADGYSNMGNALKDSGKIDEAIACYTTAIQIRPQFPDAYSNLASAYKDGGRLDDAITCYRQALSLRENFPDALSNLVHTLVMVCDWRTRDEDFSRLSRMIEEQLAQPDSLVAAQPFHGLVYPLTLKQQQDIATRFAERCKVNVALLDFPPFRFRGKRANERLRVGYVSSDFGNHPLSHLCQSIFGMHDRTRMEVFCFALTPNDGSPYRARIEREAEHFIDLSAVQNGEAAKLIHAKQIHILVNLNGYTKGARNEIFALQPAPLQCSFMGFCGTLGADYVQYAVVDRVVVPEESQEFYTEKLIVMPDSYFANDHKQSARYVLDHEDEGGAAATAGAGARSPTNAGDDGAAGGAGSAGRAGVGAGSAASASSGVAPTTAPTREKYNIPEDKFVFANFNQCYKLDPETFACWCRIVNATPNAILWLLRFPALAEPNLRAEAKKHGLKDNRLIFTDVEPREDHLKRGVLADLFLDTPVCNAHTTGCDILWSGTPMLTCMGSKMASRVAASLLRACGVESDLVTSSLEEYERVAIDLGKHPNKVWDLRKRLERARHSCALFDTARWVRNLEKGFELIWARHERGLPPANVFPDISVEGRPKRKAGAMDVK